jgi:diacylglycerol kinase (ATP)
MRAAAILGLGTSTRDLREFQQGSSDEWLVGLPSAADSVDAVLVFGGDGTVHRHLSALVQLGAPVLVVPAGSGNDFARALGLLKHRDSLAAWQAFSAGRGSVRAVDLGCITALSEDKARHYFACVGGLGLDAEVSRRANALPRWLRKSGGYALSLPAALVSFAAFRTKIWLEQENGAPRDSALDKAASSTKVVDPHEGLVLRSDRPTVLVAFANSPFYGDGMKIAPQAQLDDGLLDICLIRGMDKFKLFCLFPTVYFGRHLGLKEVEYFRTTRGVVETEFPLDVYADGEFVCKTPAEFRVARSALRVIVKP